MTDDTNTESTNPLEWARLPKAKRHKAVTNLSQRLKGCHKTGQIDLYGVRYVLRTIDPSEEDWTLPFVKGDDFYSTAKSKRGPTVAAAIVGWGDIDEDGNAEIVPIEDLFEVPEDMPEATMKLIKGSKRFERNWRRAEVLRWLSEPENHEMLTAQLYDRYLELDKERNEALVALDPLRKKAPTGQSSATSSPEKESSSPTLASNG
jgi:hypothetical protein